MNKKLTIVNWEEFLDNRLKEFKCFEEHGYRKWTKEVYEAKHFKFECLLGQGGFASVYLVRHKKTHETLALKVMSKLEVYRTQSVHYIINERKMLDAINFPFCLHSEFSFQDNSYLYFGLEFLCGTDMSRLLKRKPRLEERHARFYCGQLALALEYLHKLDIVHRDIKPTNLLVDATGYIKLADFGLAKMVKGRTYSSCGTPVYMAPEVTLGTGHSKPADWWSFGVFLYECCAGRLPFRHGLTMVNSGKAQILGIYCTPPYFSEGLTDLIHNLIQVDLTRRYGDLWKGVNDIKDHSWFSDLDWMALLNRKLSPPYRPKVSDVEEIIKSHALKKKHNHKEFQLQVADENWFGNIYDDF